MNQEFFYETACRIKSLGADHVDIIAVKNDTISAVSRLSKLEQLTRASVEDIQIRASVRKRHAVIGTNSRDNLNQRDFLMRVVESAANSPESDVEIYPEYIGNNKEELAICDNSLISPGQLADLAIECEEKTLGIGGITNSEGAEASYVKSTVFIQCDLNFSGQYDKTLFQTSIVALAEKNGELQQGYSSSESLFFKDLKSTSVLAEEAASRTLKKLGSRKIKSCVVPVIFERRCARHLLISILQAINGANVAKGMVFLRDKLHRKIMSKNISIYDSYRTGIRSRPFDSEGLRSKTNELILEGCLNNFLLNTKYANQLGLKSTHSASGFQGISANNVHVKNGNTSLEDMVSDIKEGLLITETMGDGLNIITGNYSTGACGFWIENGRIQFPVNEITLASNFTDMFANCVVASDLSIETGYDSPSIFVEKVTVGGQ